MGVGLGSVGEDWGPVGEGWGPGGNIPGKTVGGSVDGKTTLSGSISSASCGRSKGAS